MYRGLGTSVAGRPQEVADIVADQSSRDAGLQRGCSQLSSSEHFHFKGNPHPQSKQFQEKLRQATTISANGREDEKRTNVINDSSSILQN